MTAQNPPIFIQAGSHPAEDVRRWMSAMVESTPGVVAAGDMAVTQNGTPNMSVNVATGRAFINGSEATYQGTYAVENRGVQNVVVSASDPTNPRRDLIVARIKDAAYSGAANTFTIEVVTGTPAAVPVDPATPANCLVLARVAVAALATTVVNANITDLRTRAYALGVSALNTGMAKQSSRMACRLTKSVAQSAATTSNVKATFDVETFDTGGLHSTSVNTSRITIPAGGGGLWMVGYQIHWEAGGSSLRSTGVSLDGASGQFYGRSTITSASECTLNGSAIIRLNDGQYMEIDCYQTTGGNLNILGDATLNGITSFWATRLGD